MRRAALLVCVLTAAAGLILGGCGGGSPASSTSPGKAEGRGADPGARQRAPAGRPPRQSHSPPHPGPPASAFHPKPHHDSGGGSRQFIVKGGDNSVQETGSEASEAELQQAAALLHGFLDARAERNWAAACTYLSSQTRQSFAQIAGTGQRGCPASLAALTGKTPPSTLREAAIADVGSLRAQGTSGFLIYRGAPRGTVYAIPVAREDGAWKVASLSGVPLN